MLKNFRSDIEIVRACRSIIKSPTAINVFGDEEKREMLEAQSEGCFLSISIYFILFHSVSFHFNLLLV